MEKMRWEKKGKGGHPIEMCTRKQLLAIIRFAHEARCPKYRAFGESDRSVLPYYLVTSPG